MSTTLAKLKRLTSTTEAALGALLIAKQWGFATDTRRISAMDTDGVTIRYFWDSTRLADQTATYGTALIGTQGITGITPSGGGTGAAGTLQAMLTGVRDSTVLKAPYASTTNTVQPYIDTYALTLKGHASQTYDMFRVMNASGTVKAYIGIAGDMSLSSTLDVTGAVTMSSTLGVTGASTLTGLVGVGVTPSIAASMDLRNAGTSGVSQYGLTVQPTFTSTATTTGTGLYSQLNTTGAFTMATGRAILIATPSISTTTVTDLIGLDVQTLTGGTNNYAIRTGASGLIQLGSLTASSAVATDANKNLVSVTNTGTGNNVLSASPTLTGTISAASMTLSSTLGVTGITTFHESIKFDTNGTSAAGSIYKKSDRGIVVRGITSSSGKEMAIETNSGAQAFYVDSSANCEVTNSLLIEGNTASTSTSTGSLVLTGGFGLTGTINAGGDISAAAGKALIGTANTTGQPTIGAGGNVGFGDGSGTAFASLATLGAFDTLKKIPFKYWTGSAWETHYLMAY